MQRRRNDVETMGTVLLTSPTPRVPSHGCWRQWGAGGGARELGSTGYFGKHNGCAVGRNNSARHYGMPTNKISQQTKSGAGNTMVMSELTGGIDMMGLIVFLII